MEAYARNDTHYLKALSDILTEQLRQKERLPWLEQSCDRLIAECAIPTSPNRTWSGASGAATSWLPSLAVLREIWHWREQEALAANRPPFFVLSHETLIEIAAARHQKRPD
jgi:ribonuclease D